MVPAASYGGSDNHSMAADNTSGFNCRYAVMTFFLEVIFEERHDFKVQG